MYNFIFKKLKSENFLFRKFKFKLNFLFNKLVKWDEATNFYFLNSRNTTEENTINT